MANASLTIVNGPHVLWKGTNGSITAGITVRRTESKAEVEDRGYSRTYDLSTHNLKNGPYAEHLGFSVEQYADLVRECVVLETPS